MKAKKRKKPWKLTERQFDTVVDVLEHILNIQGNLLKIVQRLDEGQAVLGREVFPIIKSTPTKKRQQKAFDQWMESQVVNDQGQSNEGVPKG